MQQKQNLGKMQLSESEKGSSIAAQMQVQSNKNASSSPLWSIYYYSGRTLGSVCASKTQNLLTLSFNSTFGSSQSASFAYQ